MGVTQERRRHQMSDDVRDAFPSWVGTVLASLGPPTWFEPASRLTVSQ